jgi:hypothetical protein
MGRTDDRGSISSKHVTFLFDTKSIHILGLTQPPVLRAQGSFLKVKWPWHDADSSSPPNTEIKNACSYTSTPPYACMGWCLVKHQEQLYLQASAFVHTRTRKLLISSLILRCCANFQMSSEINVTYESGGMSEKVVVVYLKTSMKSPELNSSLTSRKCMYCVSNSTTYSRKMKAQTAST